MGPDGVSVGDQRVADRGQLIEDIARADIVEIATRRRGRGFWGNWGPRGVLRGRAGGRLWRRLGLSGSQWARPM